MFVTPAYADAPDVPSGHPVSFLEMVQDKSSYGLAFHYRFVMPALAADALTYDEVEPDMAHLCTHFALPRIAATGPQPERIVISVASEATEFGVANPDVTQFFEAYSREGALCIWEFF